MRAGLVWGVLLMAAACSPTSAPAPAPTNEPAAPAVSVTREAPAVSAPPEKALPAALVGRWGISAEACAPTNVPKDGLFEIFADRIGLGLDECWTTRVEPEGAGVHVIATCRSNIDDEADYQRDFSLVSSGPDTLTWITEGGEARPHVRCK
jgi:hypothetical protein